MLASWSGRSPAARRRLRGFLAAACCAILTCAGVVLFASPAYAAGTSVSVTPTATTVKSGTTVTYTLSVSCSENGGCTDTTVTIPTDTVTGDGSTTDFGSWVRNGTCPAMTVTAGLVTFKYGTIGNVSSQCTFTVTSPDYVTVNNAQLTITPSIQGSNFSAIAGSPATLTLTATDNVSITKGGPSSVGSGGTFSYTVEFFCGTPGYVEQGDIGLSALTITDPLPAGFTYGSYNVAGRTLPGTFTYDAGTQTLTYSDPTGATCQSTKYQNGVNGYDAIDITITGTATTGGAPDAIGSKFCNTASSSFTYLDGTPGTASTAAFCTTVTSLVPTQFVGKAGIGGSTMPNRGKGQYHFAPDGGEYNYTFPGDWDRTGTSVHYQINLGTNSTNSGVDFAVQDPLPCLDDYAGQIYSSPAPGSPCANPAFIPTLIIPPSGFTPTAADTITLIHADGSPSSTVAFTPGKGWVIPTSPAVAEIDFPQFAEEGSNGSTTMSFMLEGYASSSAQIGSLLRNTVTAQAYMVGGSTQIAPQKTSSDGVLVADPNEPSGTLLRPIVGSGYTGSCTESVGWSIYGGTANGIEIASTPSQALYFDYLAPPGASVTSSLSLQFRFQQSQPDGYYNLQQGPVAGVAPFTVGPITGTSTANYQGLGRTLYEWVIPAGAIALPGYYTFGPTTNLSVALTPGCAGTYPNDLTVGYAAPIVGCYYGAIVQSNFFSKPPANYDKTSQLTSNGVGTSNWCGNSAPLTIAPVNPGFSVTKTVQGNLDTGPVSGKVIGNVSPSGGTATYDVTFANSGQSNLTNPVMYDLLPHVGDTAASSSVPRNSQFPVTLTGVGAAPAGVTVYYSTATNPCRPELVPSNPGCTDDWSTTPPSPLSSTTALKFAYSGTVFVSGAGTNGFSVSFTVSTPDVTPGQVAWNSVGTNAYAGGTLMSPAESSLTGLQAEAGPQITKSTTATGYAKVGDTIPYTFQVTNNTAVPLADVGVVDNLTDAAAGDTAPAVTCTALTSPAGACSSSTTTLAPGQTATFTGTYTVVQGDLDHGLITDTATVTASPPSGGALTSTSAPVTVKAASAPALTVSKSVSPTVVSKAGEVVTYTFQVSNAGNVSVHGVAVVESAFTGSGVLGAVSCPVTVLAPADTESCTASYVLTQADLDAGSVTNTAHATGLAPDGSAVRSNDSSASVTAAQTGGLTLVKSADPSAAAAYKAGQLITYHYLVSNTGNVTVSGVTINETAFTGSGSLSAVSCPVTTLAPGAQVDCTATYTLSQADVDAGVLTNTATVSGTTPAGATTSAPSTVSTPQTPEPVLTLTKSADVASVSAAGDAITYSFAVQNAGNVTIGNVAIAESSFSGTGTLSAITCPDATLVPGQSETCTAGYTVTQADIDAGAITNTATATGTAPDRSAVVSAVSTATVIAARSGALTLTKTASPTSVTKAGDQITYSFAVANSGNVTLTNVVVTETKFSGTGGLAAVSCPATTLPPHQSITCTATYTVTQADIDAGTITNTAFAGATDPAGASVSSAASTATVTVTSSPALTLVKTATPTTVTAAGQKVTYSFVVTNTGNVTIGNIAIGEQSFSGSGTMSAVSCPSATLAPGASETCTATYTVTGKDMTTAAITNTAVATGTDPGGTTVTSGPSTAKVTVHKSGSSSGPTPPTTPPGGGSSSTPPSGPGSGSGGTTGVGGGAGGTSGGLGGGAAGNGGTGGSTATTGSDVLGLLGTAEVLLIAGALVLAAARRRRGRHAE